MKNTSLFRRILSVVLVVAMVCSLLVPATSAETVKTSQANATTEELTLTEIDPGTLESHKLGLTDADDGSDPEEPYAPADVVRVSIVMKKASTLEAGFDTKGIAKNASAMAYRQGLRADQTAMTAKIEKALASKLDVKLNLTLAVNIISANVRYDQIETIKALDGVEDVFVENFYEAVRGEEGDQPLNGSATHMTGANQTWAAGYTGAGSRLAILDTGVDVKHQSFDGKALEYALEQNAKAKGMSYDEYVKSLDLLTVEKINAVKDQLNANQNKDFDASKAYQSIKIPFSFNYENLNYEATHEHDEAGHHGSHVAGISAANRFIKVGDGFKPALEEVLTQGVAPDAQILNMDVFYNSGFTSDSLYMAAIEDAIILGCDSANLSLGSANSGFGFTHSKYEDLMNKLVKNDMVCVFAIGNADMWFDYNTGANEDMIPGYIYADDSNFLSGGTPATYTNTLAVASSDNDGQTANVLIFGQGLQVAYTESATYGNEPIATLAGKDLEYVLFENTGVDGKDNDLLAPYADVIAGKVVLCQRGASTFTQKVNAAAKAGAIACVIYNNQAGTISMALTGLESKIPAVSITEAEGLAVRDQSEAVTAKDQTVYYTGTVKATEAPILQMPEEFDDTLEVSTFSSYGVPGTLTMKPEILAPGGGIYSVYGALPGETTHDQYRNMSGTSMATPQVNGIAGVLSQYIRENDLLKKTGLTQRQLINSLMMSTAHPVYDAGGNYWPVIRVGAGHANVSDAVSARSYILMDKSATLFPDSAADGKVKVELGDDPKHTGEYSFCFTLYPLEGKKDFTLRTDIFTQAIAGNGGYGMLQDKSTMLLDGQVSYEVDGKTYEDATYFNDADVNQDGVTNEADAQAILDKLNGQLPDDAIFDEKAADVNGDGEINAEDANLILEGIVFPVITITKPTQVKVNIKLDKGWKDLLLADYFTKGFYVQGYTYVNPEADKEGAMDVVHSIPILGFCGSWTDPAMLDRSSVIDEAYGTGKLPYMGNTDINYLVTKDATGASTIFMGNPYLVEKTFPAERLAVRSDTTIASAKYLPIRNAINVGFAVTNAEGKALLSTLDLGRLAPYFYASAGTWRNTSPSIYRIDQNLSAAKLKEGDQVTLGFYAMPEYVAMATAKLAGKVSDVGELTKEDFEAALAAGLIGDGAAIKYNVTIDDTAPQVTSASYDYKGSFTVKAKDNHYVAYVAVMDEQGNTLYEGIPTQSKAGEAVEISFQVSGVLPDLVTVLAGDYAGNEVAYQAKASASPAAQFAEKADDLRVEPQALEMFQGGQRKIDAIVEPSNLKDKSLTWASKDESIATVAEGVVTAVKPGKTTITVTTNAEPKLTVEVSVTVTAAPQAQLRGVILEDETGIMQLATFNTGKLEKWNEVTEEVEELRWATLVDDTLYGGTGSAYVAYDEDTKELRTIHEHKTDLVGIYPSDAAPVPEALRPFWGSMVGFGLKGDYLMMWNTEEFKPDGIQMGFEDDAPAVIAFAGEQQGETLGTMAIYYFMTESGEVFELDLLSVDPWIDIRYVGSSGIQMPGAADATNEVYASMAYDAKSDCLYVTYRGDFEDYADLYVIDSKDPSRNTKLGDFGRWNNPAVGLHQYQPATDLTLKVNPTNIFLYTDEMVNLDVSVKLGKTNEFTVQVADPTVCVYDEKTGVVKGLKKGSTTLTVTTKDTNKEGKSLSETVSVTVGPKPYAFCGFEEDAVQSGWRLMDLDGDGRNWTQDPTMFHSGTSCWTSISYDLETDSAINADNWLVSPAIDLSEAVEPELSFYAMSVDGDYKDYIEVYVATKADLSNAEQLFAGKAPKTLNGWEYFAFDLIEYVGKKTVYVAIRHRDYDNYRVVVDDLLVSEKDYVDDKCEIEFFTDLEAYPHGSDEHSAIEWAYLNGITNGTSATTFTPDRTVNRAEAMTFLYRAKGEPKFEMPAAKFKDVKKKDYFYNAVMWAVANEVTEGTSATKFSPKKTCTRSEILKFFYSAEGKPAYTIKNPYSDVKKSHWYYDSAIWAYENGLEHGNGNGKFKPKTKCTRVTTVLYLYRYITGNARVGQ